MRVKGLRGGDQLREGGRFKIRPDAVFRGRNRGGTATIDSPIGAFLRPTSVSFSEYIPADCAQATLPHGRGSAMCSVHRMGWIRGYSSGEPSISAPCLTNGLPCPCST